MNLAMDPNSFPSDPLSSGSKREDEDKEGTKSKDESQKNDNLPDRSIDVIPKNIAEQIEQIEEISKNPGLSCNFHYHNDLRGSSIGNLANQVSDDARQQVNSTAEGPQKQDLELDDLTRPLPQKPKILPEVKLDGLLEYSKKLNEDSLIIITSSNSRIALSAAYALAENVQVLNKRLLTGEWGTLKRLKVEPSIENIVINPKIDGEHPSLIIVDTYEMQTFLDSLIVRDSTVASLKEDLNNSRRLCICLADSQALRTILERKRIQLSFPHWEIPFEQEEVDREGKNSREPSISSYEEGQAAISLYETADILKKTVLYVATFFQNLNISDFERIITLLLADQTAPTIESENRTEVPTNSSESTISVTVADQVITFNPSQKGQVYQKQVNRVNQPHTRRLLRDIWEEDTQQILKSCHLEFTPNEYGARVIDFSMPHLRDELSEYFQNVRFIDYRNKFRKLIELKLLFDESSQIARALRDLSVSMMLFQPETDFWVNWLEQAITSAMECNASRKNLVYNYISDLLRATLDYSQLEDITKNFLERMISLQRHDVVLSLSKRLRFSPQFDEYYWFKQSIDRGGNDIASQAYQLIYKQLKQSKSRIYETLEKIYAWVPDLEVDRKRYSPSNRCALQLLLEYLIETLEKFDQKFYGEEVFSYPLFGGLRSYEFIDRRLKMIVEWLLHPGMDSIIDPGMDSIINEVDSLSLISIFIFPSLFNILLGLKEDVSVKAEFSGIVDSLLISINDVIEAYEKKVNKEYRLRIVAYWRILSIFLLEASNHEIENNKNWDQGDLLNYRRNIVDYLIEKIDP